MPSAPQAMACGWTQSPYLFLLRESPGRDLSRLHLPGLWRPKLCSGACVRWQPWDLRPGELDLAEAEDREHLTGACWEHCWGSGMMGGAQRS